MSEKYKCPRNLKSTNINSRAPI